VLVELDKRASRLREVECPCCKALISFRRARFPHIDEQGFETYALNCKYCRSCLVGVLDPLDGALLLPAGADKAAALTQWRRAWPLAGLALAAVVNVAWVGVLGYALVRLL
jgi:hypothetical protein